MEEYSSLRKNPSRKTCEDIIRRILFAEIAENGKNEHFRSAADFMSYFESLYPASEALTKQVQRAVKTLDMPRDEKGCFIVNKSKEQLAQEKELSSALQKANACVSSLTECVPVLLKAEASLCPYLTELLNQSPSIANLIVTITACSNGLLLYTTKEQELLASLAHIMDTGLSS